MAKILKGAPVASAITARTKEKAEAMKAAGVIPTLAILRVGKREDDLSYERGAMKRCAEAGIETRSVVLAEDATQEAFDAALISLNKDDAVHGILLLLPLPRHLDAERARALIAPEKDVDGCTDASLTGVFTDKAIGFAPCTAQAVIEILDHYQLPVEGKRAVIIGRSLVIGRPAAMLLMHRQATPTICHTKTKDIKGIAKAAEILVVASGQKQLVGGDFLAAGQTVIDVGIHYDEEKGKLCGDVLFDEAERVVENITPVPGGVGAVTTAVLAAHVAEAAERSLG